MRIVTWNIHGCRGLDGRRDVRRVAAVLEEIRADVIGLQEVDSRRRSAGDRDQFEYLADATRSALVAGPTILDERGHFGNALLVRRPLLASRVIDLSVDRREPRGAIEADVRVGETGVLRVVTTHLGLRQPERKMQMERLLSHLEEEAGPFALLGDFNEWWPLLRIVKGISSGFGAAKRLRTFPARWPLLCLDRIWGGGGARVTDVVVHASPLARRASDHLPVRASVEIECGGEAIGLIAVPGEAEPLNRTTPRASRPA